MRRRGDRTGRSNRWMAAVAVVGLLAAGCSDGGDDPGAEGPGTTGGGAAPDGTVELDGELIAALERYDSCDAFLADVTAEALDRVGPYGLGNGGGPGFGTWGFAAAESADDSTDSVGGSEARSSAPIDGAAGQATGGDPSVSGTNLQEADVDEPDVVKTDGELMVTVLDQELHVLDVTDPAAPRLLSTSPLAGWDAEVLLAGDTLLVLQQVGGWAPEPGPASAERIGTPDERLAPAPADSDGSAAGDIARPGGPWVDHELTTITEVDLADPAAPDVRRTWTAEGRYVSARAVDGVARIVVQGDPSRRLPFVFPSTPEAEDAAEAANRAVIEGSTLDDWVPSITLSGPDGDAGEETRLAPCDQLYRPSTFSGFGMVGVLTADLGADGGGPGLDPDLGVGVLSTGETVYASADHLYVATQQWTPGDAIPFEGEIRPAPESEGTTTTEVHQFVLDGAAPAAYAASGSIEGRILDQWSLSEHDGHLRVAVTEGEAWGESASSVSSVVVLRPEGDRLVETGRVTDLGRGERIYAVRFMGDRGYVVTFRQIDPLYSLDLADPAAPAMTGELKITGFSSYLHPVSDDLLLGIGQDATEEGRILGTQVSLFDVSDPASPTRVDQVALGEGSSSEVETDHRAFLFWDGVALVPYMSWNWTEEGGEDVRNGVVGIAVDAEARTLTERGRLSHVGRSGGAIGEPAPAAQIEPGTPWRGEHEVQIRRSMGIDGRVLTISPRGVLSSPLDTLEPGTWMPLG